MKARELVAELQKVDGDAEVYIHSCCFPETKWIDVGTDDGEVHLAGYQGSYVAGDPETSPW